MPNRRIKPATLSFLEALAMLIYGLISHKKTLAQYAYTQLYHYRGSFSKPSPRYHKRRHSHLGEIIELSSAEALLLLLSLMHYAYLFCQKQSVCPAMPATLNATAGISKLFRLKLSEANIPSEFMHTGSEVFQTIREILGKTGLFNTKGKKHLILIYRLLSHEARVHVLLPGKLKKIQTSLKHKFIAETRKLLYIQNKLPTILLNINVESTVKFINLLSILCLNNLSSFEKKPKKIRRLHFILLFQNNIAPILLLLEIHGNGLQPESEKNDLAYPSIFWEWLKPSLQQLQVFIKQPWHYRKKYPKTDEGDKALRSLCEDLYFLLGYSEKKFSLLWLDEHFDLIDNYITEEKKSDYDLKSELEGYSQRNGLPDQLRESFLTSDYEEQFFLVDDLLDPDFRQRLSEWASRPIDRGLSNAVTAFIRRRAKETFDACRAELQYFLPASAKKNDLTELLFYQAFYRQIADTLSTAWPIFTPIPTASIPRLNLSGVKTSRSDPKAGPVPSLKRSNQASQAENELSDLLSVCSGRCLSHHGGYLSSFHHSLTRSHSAPCLAENRHVFLANFPSKAAQAKRRMVQDPSKACSHRG